jgi:hypothetical protein
MLAANYTNSCQEFGALNLAILQKTDLLYAGSNKDWDLAMGQNYGFPIYLREGVYQHVRQHALILRLYILAKELHPPNSIAWLGQLTLRSLSRQSPFMLAP